GDVRCLELPAVLLRAFRSLDTLDAGELLASAARLLRALARAVASHELLGPLDLVGLLAGGLRRRGLTLGALPRVRRIAAAVFHDRALLERQSPPRYAIEEPAIVTTHQNRLVFLDEEPLQPFERGY